MHQDHPARRTTIDAVTPVIGDDQAGGAGPNHLLDQAIERRTQFYQVGPFYLEHLPDGLVFERKVPRLLGVGDALVFQPGNQLNETPHPRLGPEQMFAWIAILFFGPPFLLTRHSACTRFGQPRRRLHRVLIPERGFLAADCIAHRRPQHLKQRQGLYD